MRINLLEYVKKIDWQLKACMIASLILCMVTHGYLYTHLLPFHDGAQIFSAGSTGFSGVSGGRWLQGFLYLKIDIPWLQGLIMILVYGLISYMICKLLKIQGQLATILAAGILVTSVNAISISFYFNQGHIFFLSLLFAVAAVYAFYEWKYGFVWAVVFLALCAGIYAPYISMALMLFFVREIVDCLYYERSEGLGQKFLRHLKMLVAVGFSLIATYLICNAIAGVNVITAQDNGGNAAASTATSVTMESSGLITTIIAGMKSAYLTVIGYFSPFQSKSYFQDRHIYYGLFLLAMLATLVVCLHFLRDSLRECRWNLLVLLIDVALLPLAMNVLGIVHYTHLAMTCAFVAPWLLVLSLAEAYLVEREGSEQSKLCLVYEGLVVLMLVVTVLEGIYLANASYIRIENLIDKTRAQANRIVMRIEEMEGYQVNETPVAFYGSPDQYFEDADEYDLICDDLVGQVTGFTSDMIFANILNEQAGACMSIVRVDFEEIDDEIKNAAEGAEFPDQDAIFWQGDTIVVLL